MPEEIRIAPQEGPQTKFLQSSADIVVFGGAAGGGKVVRRGGVVLTSFGFKKIEDIKVGDRVNAPDGTTSRVIQLKPWVRLKGVRVHFHDGTSTDVAWDHLWLAWRSGKRKKLPNGECCHGEPAAEVIETRQLKQWLDSALEKADKNAGKGKHKNANWPLIPVCQPQVFNVQSPYPILLDPYKLGVWLGDGHASKNKKRHYVGVTSVDVEHMEEHFPELIQRDDRHWKLGIRENDHWTQQLDRAGLLGRKSHDKFIPRQYLYASIEDRWAILQGLMDTDGTADTRGQLYYCTVSEQLSKDVCHLVQSLGGTATVFEKKPFYRNDDGEKVHCQLAYNIYIKLHDEKKAFRLERKKRRCKSEGNMYRRVVKIEEIEEIEGRCITVSHPSGLYLTNDFIVTHNSYALLLDAMRYAISPHDNSGYRATLFRKSFAQIEQPGGLKETSDNLYPYCGAEFHQGRMQWKFPCGARISFAHMEHEKDKLKYQGAQIPWIGFDELTHFSQSQFLYMLSRNRSACGVPTKIRASCNPDASSWVAELIEWWIDQDSGYPIDERSGVCRWFVRLDNVMYWGDSPQELWDKVKDFYRDNPEEFLPKSLTFIGSKLSDNKILCESDPSYKANLMAMGQAEQEILLRGNWMINPAEGAEWEHCPHYFERHIWTDSWPDDFICSSMYIDPSKGRTERSDYSAIVFVGCKGGKMFVRSDIKRRPAEQIVQDAMRMYMELKPSVLAIERNTFQELLGPMFDRAAEELHLPPFPIVFPYSGEKKEVRIKKLGPYLDAKKILLQKDSNSNKILYDQLKNFGIAKHDDGPDALEGAIRVLYDLNIDPMADVSDRPRYGDEPDVESVVW